MELRPIEFEYPDLQCNVSEVRGARKGRGRGQGRGKGDGRKTGGRS